ncbi:mono/diheme cytochrome c family protein [Deinobacterium chartae]|uniref:Mono/diheme cytochrome c family protein n=1 Tax=Deinobacterium chartae TaxID=521158 RepID=A0A841I587_9DEIO|nr:cytochrome c [Deinobacterium chartae]MBB6099608.1 mono/diheme cytochrome c family protein [Deinobacterium chartae]
MRRTVVLAFGLLLPAALLASARAADGKALYSANCAGCHQATGKGVPNAFPPLAAHLPKVVAAKNGRAYLINVVLYGLQGQIRAGGANYNGAMPGFAQLKDDEVAAVLNYTLTAWGNKLPAGQKPLSAAEVKKERAAKKTAAQVLKLRPKGLK